MVFIADSVGWLLYGVLRVRRTVIDEQLRIAFGDSITRSRLNVIGMQAWQNAVLTFFEFLQPEPLAAVGWDAFEHREGYAEHVLPLLERGNALILTGHIGNWEALGRLGPERNFQISAVAKPMHNPLVNHAILKARARRGLEVLSTAGSLKKIVGAARDGKWVAFLGDQDARRHGIFVDFFGQPASTAEGPAYFAWKLNLPLLPAFCVRDRDRHRKLKLVVLPPIMPDPSQDRDVEIRRITRLHVEALESVIRQYPGDYFWLHRRWKTKPKRKGNKHETKAGANPAN